MRTKVTFLTYDQILSSLASLGFDVRQSPGVANHIVVTKYGAGAALAPAPPSSGSEASAAAWIHHPGFVVAGEIATLLDRGYQKFWKSSRLELPATADSLRAVHRFAEELREVIGEPSLYNESLGTTSDVYLYDRVKGRDLPVSERPAPAWRIADGTAS